MTNTLSQTVAWRNDYPLTDEKIRHILHEQFPELKVEVVYACGEGWDNTTWKINEEWLFRFPKHSDAELLIKNEINVLPAFSFLPVATPLPQWIGKPSDQFPLVFYGHRFLIGETADRYELNEHDRILLAKPLAVFLKTLHQASIKSLHNIQIPPRVDPLFRLDRVESSFDYLVKQNILKANESIVDFFKAHYEQKISETLVLAHGDFYARHLLLNQQKQLNAVIDWGDSCLAHPAIDLSIVYQFLPKKSHFIFWDTYGAVDEETKLLASLRAIHYALTLTWYSHCIQDQALFREGLYAIENIRHSIKKR